MCGTCGCTITEGNQHLVTGDGQHAHTEKGGKAVDILQNLLSANDHQAQHNREHFDKHAVLAINLMSSPGTGKTALLETTIEALKEEFSIAVIEGDLETENDANRIRAHGVPAVQIVTGTACHLDAHLVHKALHSLDLAKLDIVFIENVGNLVCPASFDLGHHSNITLLSTTEGDDKPLKYPVMFRAADAVLITKTDLLAVLDDFSCEKVKSNMQQLANTAPVLQLSATKNQNIEPWLTWIRAEIQAYKKRLAEGTTQQPKIQADSIHTHSSHS